MNSKYFTQDTIQSGGNNSDYSVTLIISRCGCGLDKLKTRLDKYNVPYIDAYQLLFPIFTDQNMDNIENIIMVCIKKLAEACTKSEDVIMFFPMHIRGDVMFKQEYLLKNLLTRFRSLYSREIKIIYLNFDPLLLFSIMNQSLSASSQIIDTSILFDILTARDLILLNDYPIEFMYHYNINTIETNYSDLPSNVLEYFKQHINKYIYIKLYRNENFALTRMCVINVTKDIWENKMDELYNNIVNKYIEIKNE